MSAAGDRMILAKIKAERRIDDDMRKQFLKVFELLDEYDLDVSYPAFEAAFIQVISDSSAKFLTLEQSFLRTYAALEHGVEVAAATNIHKIMDYETQDRLRASLKSVTATSIKVQAANGHSIPKARDGAKQKAIGVAMRYAREPAREYGVKTATQTQGLKGYKRVGTGSEDCSFCRMLQSRGAVYDADSGNFLAHDHCDCVLVPEKDGPSPTMAQKYVASARKSNDFDKDKAKQHVEEYQKRLVSGEELPVAPPRG